MSGPPLWRLPPWSRAPLLGLRSPAAVVAVLVTSAILACAVASAPLFLSSARSAALQEQLAPQCAEAAWPQIGTSIGLGDPDVTAAGITEFADGYRQAWGDLAGRSERVLLVERAVGSAGNYQTGMLVDSPAGGRLSQPANVLWRPGITGHVEVVESSDTTGVWLPASYAQVAGAGVGDTITMGGLAVPVAGIYTDLFETDPGPYWCDYGALYLNLASANTPPPALVLASDEDTFMRLAATARAVEVREQIPLDATTLSSADAQRWVEAQERAQAATPFPDQDFAAVNDRLPAALGRAETIEQGLQGPVLPVAIAGGLLALVLVAAAGSFWADHRAGEVRLLAARGVGPIPLAGKAALELGLPALAGAALGWAVARLLIAGLGPADDLDPSATTAALWAGVGAFVVGLAGAAAVAGLRARGTAERPLGAAPRWPAAVPWELALLVAAGWCWVLLESREGIVSDGGVAQVNGLLVAFPLLGLAGAAVLLTRLLTRLLPALRRSAARRSPAVFLAVNRLAAGRLATATLLVAVTLPVAVLGYTATLTSSAAATLDAKVGVQVGAGRAVVTVARIERNAQTAAVGTVVDRYNGSAADPETGRIEVQVLAVDPATFARTAYWQDSFADESLDDLVVALEGPEVDGRLPVVAAGLPEGDPDLRVGRTEVPAEVVGTARLLPGRRAADPLVLVAADRLPDVPREAGADRVSELWTDAPRGRAVDVATAAGATGPRVIEPDDVFTTANFLGITWTFGYLSALAVFVGVIAAGGLLLYLEARSRTRVSGYVMARRLGLTRGAHLRSLVVELGGVALAGLVLGAGLAAVAVSVVYRRLDVDLVRPPTPLLDVPWLAIAATALVAVAVAVLAASYAQRAADRADPASVLREDA